jgi:hypothetical protein
MFPYIIAIFIAFMILNVYLRITVLKHYKYLTEHRVNLDVKLLLWHKQALHEVCAQEPKHSAHIKTFILNLKYGLLIAVGLVCLIILLAIFIKN